jgi:hypothetical protein
MIGCLDEWGGGGLREELTRMGTNLAAMDWVSPEGDLKRWETWMSWMERMRSKDWQRGRRALFIPSKFCFSSEEEGAGDREGW